MSQKNQRFTPGPDRPKAKFEDIPEFLLTVTFRPPTQGARHVFDQRDRGVNCGSVLSWGLLTDESSQAISYPVASVFDAG
jgi:hypothetical protein